MSAELTGFRHSMVHTIRIHSQDGRLVELVNMINSPQGVLDVYINIPVLSTPNTPKDDK